MARLPLKAWEGGFERLREVVSTYWRMGLSCWLSLVSEWVVRRSGWLLVVNWGSFLCCSSSTYKLQTGLALVRYTLSASVLEKKVDSERRALVVEAAASLHPPLSRENGFIAAVPNALSSHFTRCPKRYTRRVLNSAVNL